MNQVSRVSTTAKDSDGTAILIIYTGGTFGMVFDEDGSLVPFDFDSVLRRIPEIQHLELNIKIVSLSTLLDSSNVNPSIWREIGDIISDNYVQFDGFVILHGTDTMAYTASALSFSLDQLNKPVILTGAQIPIGQIRSDARENLITALEIASTVRNGIPLVGEVCIYFNFLLLRGNRSQKVRSSTFAAFESQNYPILAESGINIEFNPSAIREINHDQNLILRNNFDNRIAVLDIFPGISKDLMESILSAKNIKGVVMRSFGSGNVPSEDWLLNSLKLAVKRGLVVLNISQCSGGEVIHGRYETSKRLMEIGVISGGDMTTEAAIAKMMFLLGTETDNDIILRKLSLSLAGEMDE